MGKFRRGAMIGFGFGYVMGSKAGHDRYLQIMKYWGKVKRTSVYQMAAGQVEEVVGSGIERGKLIALDGLHRATGKMIREKRSDYGFRPGKDPDVESGM